MSTAFIETPDFETGSDWDLAARIEPAQAFEFHGPNGARIWVENQPTWPHGGTRLWGYRLSPNGEPESGPIAYAFESAEDALAAAIEAAGQ